MAFIKPTNFFRRHFSWLHTMIQSIDSCRLKERNFTYHSTVIRIWLMRFGGQGTRDFMSFVSLMILPSVGELGNVVKNFGVWTSGLFQFLRDWRTDCNILASTPFWDSDF